MSIYFHPISVYNNICRQDMIINAALIKIWWIVIMLHADIKWILSGIVSSITWQFLKDNLYFQKVFFVKLVPEELTAHKYN